MSNIETWRDLLKRAILTPTERERIANAIGVNPITLVRWVHGESKPRPYHLRKLVATLPEHREQLFALLSQELEDDLGGETPEEISSDFYANILRTSRITPEHLRQLTMIDAILQQALHQLDAQGLQIRLSVIQCVPPADEKQPVRSLCEINGKGMPPWSPSSEPSYFFLGAESLAGHAVMKGALSTVDLASWHVFPASVGAYETCAAACPIGRATRVAGCLLVSSTQPDAFTSPSQRALIEKYADLLSICFNDAAFSPQERIELRILPPYAVQKRCYASSYKKHAEQVYRQAAQAQQPLSHPQVEMLMLQRIEEELLSLSPDEWLDEWSSHSS